MFPSLQTMLLHPTNDYDFLIHLDPSVIPRYTENLHADPSVWKRATKYANVRVDSTSVYGADPRIQFDPVQLFFQDIQVCDCINIAGHFDINVARALIFLF